MRVLATHPESLKLSLHCIGPTATERLKDLPGNVKSYYVPDADTDKGMSGSTAHGACVEHAIQMFDDGDIHIVCDSDTVVLARGWDDYIRGELLDRKVGIIGTTYENVGGFTSGGGHIQTYKNIPTVTWVAFSPLHQWRDLRVMPQKGDDIPIANEGMARVYNLPVGHRVLRDVGWQVPEYLSQRGISYVGWKQRKGSKDAVVLRGLSDYHEEYHVQDDGPTGSPSPTVPFVVHHRGSMRHSYRGDRISQNFYNAVDKHLVDEKLHAFRWNWTPLPENHDALKQLDAQRDRGVARNSEFEKLSGVIPPPVAAPTPVTANAPQATDQATVGGWLKATMGDSSIWGRYNTPVPQVVNVEYVPSQVCKHLRLEGTVSGVRFQVPPAPFVPHAMTVRNMTDGPVTFRAPEGQGKLTCEIPVGCCWYLLVDVDGVTHIT